MARKPRTTDRSYLIFNNNLPDPNGYGLYYVKLGRLCVMGPIPNDTALEFKLANSDVKMIDEVGTNGEAITKIIGEHTRQLAILTDVTGDQLVSAGIIPEDWDGAA